MQFYTKINTCFKREDNHTICPLFSTEEIELLKNLKWGATEKIDGTNMSFEIIFQNKNENNQSEKNLTFNSLLKNYNLIRNIHGKTETASIPTFLYKKMDDIFSGWSDEQLVKIFSKEILDKDGNFDQLALPAKVEIFGEGFGAKIQKGGGNYIPTGCDFALFGVKITNINGTFITLKYPSKLDIANKLNIKIVPYIGELTIYEACKLVLNGFKSTIAIVPDTLAEGLVLEAPLGLLDRRGNAIITKIKLKDFREYKNKTGKDFPIESIK